MYQGLIAFLIKFIRILRHMFIVRTNCIKIKLSYLNIHKCVVIDEDTKLRQFKMN